MPSLGLSNRQNTSMSQPNSCTGKFCTAFEAISYIALSISEKYSSSLDLIDLVTITKYSVFLKLHVRIALSSSNTIPTSVYTRLSSQGSYLHTLFYYVVKMHSPHRISNICNFLCVCWLYTICLADKTIFFSECFKMHSWAD